MKKNLFMLGLAAAVLASCSKSETLEEPGGTQKQAIGFNSYVSNTTRAAAPAIDLIALKDKGFYVHGAFMKTGDANPTVVFEGKGQSHVEWIGESYDKGSWGYSPENYWAADATYKFAAFAPALDEKVEHSFNYGNNALTISNFVADGKTDLVVAATALSGIAANDKINGENEPVGFSFRHALSRVKITFKNGWRNDMKVVITNIKLSGVKTTGSLTTKPGLQSSVVGLDDWNTEISPVDASTPAPISLENGNYVDYNGNYPGSNKFGDEYVFENFMIPQIVNENTIKLSFQISITNNQNGGPDLDGNGGHTATLEAYLPKTQAVYQWTPGLAYNYVITINGDTFGLKPIEFTVDAVTDWRGDNTIDWTVESQTPAVG